jgi:uncharacterized metal-binding protein
LRKGGRKRAALFLSDVEEQIMSEKKEKIVLSCAKCSSISLKTGNTACKTDPKVRKSVPSYCPAGRFSSLIEETFKIYTSESEDAKIARAAAQVEGCSYRTDPDLKMVIPRWTRLEDTIAFAKLMGYKKIGIATCIGLLEETRLLSDVLEAQGFEAHSLCCKAGSLDKLALGLKEEEKVRPGGFEAACNPIAQARILNEVGTDMNILLGLCVGHDALFTRHSNAPVTTLVAKDRVTGHNPVCALYGQYYFKRVKKPLVVKPGERE